MNNHFSRLAVLFCWLPLFARIALGQCPPDAELNITSALYSQENGLRSNMLAGIAKDNTGYRYFLGVDGKWIRYDGVNFSAKSYDRYSFDHAALKNFEGDAYSDEYIGSIHYRSANDSDGGGYKWSLKEDSLVRQNADGKYRKAYLLPEEMQNAQNLSFFPLSKTCWVTAPGKVCKFDVLSEKFISMILPIEIDERLMISPFIFPANDGSIYLLSQNSVLKLSDGSDAFEKFCTIKDDPFQSFLHELVMQQYLFLAAGNILYEIDIKDASVTTIDLASYENIENVSALQITSLRNYHDYLLIGTSNAGLFIFNRCTNSMQHFQYERQSSDHKLTNSVIWIAVDDDNVIWVQTEAGLLKLEINEQNIKTYTPSLLRNGGICNDCNNVRAIYQKDNKNLLIGTLGGVYSFDPGTAVFSNVLSPLTGQPVWNDKAISAIAGDGKGNVFIASWGNDGVLLLNEENKMCINILRKEANEILPYTSIRCLFYDSHNVLWIGTDRGIIRITNIGEFEASNLNGKLNVRNGIDIKGEPAAVQILDCFCIAGDEEQNIWMGTVNGLYVYNYEKGTITQYVHRENDSRSLSDNEVRSIWISGTRDVWIGTNNGGLNHFDKAANIFSSFNTENGLPNNSIYTIAEDSKAYLWLGTNAGLCRFNKADHSVRNFTPRDGLQNFEFNTNAVCSITGDKFCFGGRTGFNIFHPDLMNTTFAPPQAVITNFKIFDKDYPVGNSVLHLSHNENSFSFDFAVLNYFRSNDNQYAYMLEGADKDWIKAGRRQYTSYANLPPGKYTFNVKAANYTGLWNDEVTTMQIIISPAWYNTWWFRVIILLLIAAFIYSLYRYRLRQMLKLQTLRNNIASDLHDEIGSTLSSISLSSTIIQKKLKGSNADAEKLLQQVSNNTDSMMEALSDIVWAINTRNDRFGNVINRMRAFAIEILEPAGISIQFYVHENIQDIQLNMQQRKDLYLIFKEAIHNSMKYAGCKNIVISIIKQGNKTLNMTIQDDGAGFEIPAAGNDGLSLSGNGIRNMKKRAGELGGKIEIKTAKAEGTAIHLTFPI